jgi:hypothetical protein
VIDVQFQVGDQRTEFSQQPGDLGVGHGLGDDDAPDDQAGAEIGGQPADGNPVARPGGSSSPTRRSATVGAGNRPR